MSPSPKTPPKAGPASGRGRGAPKGNQNGAKTNFIFGDQLRLEVMSDKCKRLRRAAKLVVEKAAKGDIKSIELLFDRLDGKARQAIDLTGKMETTSNVQFYLPSKGAAPKAPTPAVGTEEAPAAVQGTPASDKPPP